MEASSWRNSRPVQQRAHDTETTLKHLNSGEYFPCLILLFGADHETRLEISCGQGHSNSRGEQTSTEREPGTLETQTMLGLTPRLTGAKPVKNFSTRLSLIMLAMALPSAAFAQEDTAEPVAAEPTTYAEPGRRRGAGRRGGSGRGRGRGRGRVHHGQRHVAGVRLGLLPVRHAARAQRPGRQRAEPPRVRPQPRVRHSLRGWRLRLRWRARRRDRQSALR
jgi:hypothetical protein